MLRRTHSTPAGSFPVRHYPDAALVAGVAGGNQGCAMIAALSVNHGPENVNRGISVAFGAKGARN